MAKRKPARPTDRPRERAPHGVATHDPALPLAGKRVLFGVSGSIAAYRAGDVVRELGRRGAVVVVVMTDSAKRLVTAETFRALTGREVYSELFPDAPERTLGEPFGPAGQPIHIKLASDADIVVVAPATANLMAKMAAGIADDLLSTLLLVARAPVLVAPAMNPYMLSHPTVRANAETLASRGVRFIDPDVGLLACGYEGEGKLASVEAIVASVEAVAASMPPGPGMPLGAPGASRENAALPARGPFDAPRLTSRANSLAGKRVLVTAGRTEEPIDPVRYISNHSSGRMGFAIAAEARDRGADVEIVAGVTDVPAPLGVRVARATTASAMAGATKRAAQNADIVVMCAAVSDWRPAKPSAEKIKKGKSAAVFALSLERTEDILASLGHAKRNGTLLVGFALETSGAALAEGKRKLREKGADLIVVNGAGESGTGPGAENNRVALVDASGRVEKHASLPKAEVARIILDKIEALLAERSKSGSGTRRGTARERGR
ncbi:MAG: bifunctional phosphopantothenoylcysteine decarboxylase/phosphopantothenate synthase [bacterium]